MRLIALDVHRSSAAMAIHEVGLVRSAGSSKLLPIVLPMS
jgi:hypothetical protein